MAGQDSSERLDAVEARVEALNVLLKSTLTTLVMRGVLTKADVPTLVRESEAALATTNPAGRQQLRSIEADMPSFLRAAMGPAPDDDHDHD